MPTQIYTTKDFHPKSLTALEDRWSLILPLRGAFNFQHLILRFTVITVAFRAQSLKSRVCIKNSASLEKYCTCLQIKK